MKHNHSIGDRMIRQRMDKTNKFVSRFDTENGSYFRSGVLGLPKTDPFMSSMPELIDVGIMGSCENARDRTCLEAGIQCYQGGTHREKPHMTLENFKSIIDQTKEDVYQVALGGHGNPNKHPNFEEFVKYSRENNVVPNYTTSGKNLTDEEIDITNKYCGAVAVSEHRIGYTRDAIERFIKAGITTNIHYVLGKNTIVEATRRLRSDDWDEDINAIIFLLHKPVGLGRSKNVLQPDDIKEFLNVVDNHDGDYKIGFDSCTIPGIINYSKNINPVSIDTCEGGRFSCYITPDMKMLPCSFDQDEKWAVDITKASIKQAWYSDKFTNFRNHLRNSCPNCEVQADCMGSCPIVREIVLCDRDEKKFY
jgi:radical SAM protein with 4Fe4S-binding SPASM domain